eukprot:GFUD01002694.1.p1 GENE.GFUD01002694.1~~GFUD01002694.1.p1  ORF type:complete len:196 (-),score=52.99 GFUD01002694.1:156-743(-)
MKLTPCLVVCLAIMKGTQGDYIMRMEREENYMERMNAMELATLFQDSPLFRVKRDQMSVDCVNNVDTLLAETMKCVNEATQLYQSEIFEGGEVRDVPEGYTKPNYYARKTCNYLTTAFQDCFNIMGKCLPEEKLTNQKDLLIKEAVKNTVEYPGFQTDKCPITKDYMERHPDGSNSSQSLTVSLLLLFLSAILGF